MHSADNRTPSWASNPYGENPLTNNPWRGVSVSVSVNDASSQNAADDNVDPTRRDDGCGYPARVSHDETPQGLPDLDLNKIKPVDGVAVHRYWGDYR